MIPRPERRKQRCIRGHDLTDPANTAINASGYRYCIACNRTVAREWKQRQRENENQPRASI